MGILLDKFDKFIVEHGSAIVRGDHIALLPEQLQIAEKQIARLEKENGDLKTENAALKDDVKKARAEVAKLTPQTKALSHEDLEETDMTVLKLIAIAQNQPWAQAIADESGIDLVRVEYSLQRLVVGNYIERRFGGGAYPDSYLLKQKGREFLITRNLV